MGRSKKKETKVSSRSPPLNQQSTEYACAAERLGRKYLRRYEEEQLLVGVRSGARFEQMPQEGDVPQPGHISCGLGPAGHRNATEDHGAAIGNQHFGSCLLGVDL